MEISQASGFTQKAISCFRSLQTEEDLRDMEYLLEAFLPKSLQAIGIIESKRISKESNFGFFALKPELIKGNDCPILFQKSKNRWILFANEMSNVEQIFSCLNWEEPQYFGGLGNEFIPLLPANLQKDISPCQTFAISRDVFEAHQSKWNTFSDESFTIDSLQEKDSEMVNKHWKFAKEVSSGYIPERTRSITSCLRNSDKEMVAWILTHYDLSLGMLHTLPQYRGKGLARKLATDIITKVMNQKKEFPPEKQSRKFYDWVYCHIETENKPSGGLFLSLNFQSIFDVSWVDTQPPV